MQGRQAALPSKCNSNKTFLSLLETTERQATINEALYNDLQKEKANNEILTALVDENISKSREYRQTLGAVSGELRTTNQTLEYATKQLQECQEEVQEAGDCIDTQEMKLQDQAQTICTLAASNEALFQQSEALERSNGFLNKQLIYERNSNKTLMAELRDCRGKLASAEAQNNKLAQQNEELKAAGDCQVMFSTILAAGSEKRVLFLTVMVLVSVIVQASVLLHILMLTTLFSKLCECLVAAPYLLREARIYATVLWGLACDVLGYLADVEFGWWSACCIGSAGLLHNGITSTTSLVCSAHSSSLNMWASSTERLLRRVSSWSSTCVTPADVTPVDSSRCSLSVDAVSDCASDGAAADVYVVLSLKQGRLAKDTDI